jgi:uroporphyrinogen-III synthase
VSALNGKRIIITRAPHQAAEFERLLCERGAVPLAYPCIDIAPPQNTKPLDDALRDAAANVFDWLVLTSANTVQAVANRILNLGLKLPPLKTAAVGPATADAVHRLLGLETTTIPDTYTAEGLATVVQPAPGMRILLPQSAIAEETLASALKAAGASVVSVEAYQTVIGSGGVNLPALLEAGTVDAVTLTSPSTVYNLMRRFEIEQGNLPVLKNVCIACIGTKTTRAAREHGFFVSVMPDEYTIPGLVEALEQYFESEMRNDVRNERKTGADF